MLKTIPILIILIMSIQSVYTQYMTPSADVAVGYESDGYLIRAGYNRLYGKSLITLAGQVHFESHTAGAFNQSVTSNLYLVNMEYHYELLNRGGSDFVIYVGGGAIVGYESIENATFSNNGYIIQESDVVYGGQVGATMEKYLVEISHRSALALLINIRQNYFLQSTLGDTQFNASIGARYLF